MDDQSPAERSIDAFFLNPAYIMKSHKPQSTLTIEPRYSGEMNAPSNNNSQNQTESELDLARQNEPSTANITSLVDEPLFWHGYTSDEEAVSPIQGDDMNWDELDDASFTDLPPLSPVEEQRATVISQAHQSCTHAQAITILSAGRPKMVTVPKSLDSPRSETDSTFGSLPNKIRLKTTSNHLRSYSLDAPSNDRNSSDYSQKDSLDSSGPISPLSTAPSSIHEQPPRPHRSSVSSKHIPLMEAARHVPLMEAVRMGSPTSPSLASPTIPNSSYTWGQPPAPTSAPTASRSSMSQLKSGVLSALINKFESNDSNARRTSRMGSNNISRIGKQLLRRDTIEDIEDGYVSKVVDTSNQFSQPAPKSSIQPTKMVARGADERAPVLTLPSCPGDFSGSFESEWPRFQESPQQPHSARITTVA